MKYASSIRYGGQLIEAKDCDYEDYKYLGLLCPNCKEPVFLQSQSQRTLVEKIIDIPPHFKHFAAKEPALIKQCETRVAKYDQKELERRAVIARNQRLKLLQRWFWAVVTKHPKFGDLSHINTVMSNMSKQSYFSKIESDSLRLISSFKKEDFKVAIKDVFTSLFEQKTISTHWVDGLIVGIEKPEFIFQNVEKLTSKVDIKMHQLICSEALDFLFGKNQQALFQKLFMIEFFRFCLGAARVIYKGEIPTNELQGVERGLNAAGSGIVLTIATTPWADEFAKLQKNDTTRTA